MSCTDDDLYCDACGEEIDPDDIDAVRRCPACGCDPATGEQRTEAP